MIHYDPHQDERNFTHYAGERFGHHIIVTPLYHRGPETFRYAIRGIHNQSFDGFNSDLVRQNYREGCWQDDNSLRTYTRHPHTHLSTTVPSFGLLHHRKAVAILRALTSDIAQHGVRKGSDFPGHGEVRLEQYLDTYGRHIEKLWRPEDLKVLDTLRQNLAQRPEPQPHPTVHTHRPLPNPRTFTGRRTLSPA